MAHPGSPREKKLPAATSQKVCGVTKASSRKRRGLKLPRFESRDWITEKFHPTGKKSKDEVRDAFARFSA